MTDKENELYQDRLKKLAELHKQGVVAYPVSAQRTHTTSKVLEAFSDLEKSSSEVTVAGRIRSLRTHGKIFFGDLEDESGKMQFALKADSMPTKRFELFTNLDIGDHVQLSGTLFTTKKGEQTLLVQEFMVLSKSLRALPDAHYGLKDIEIRLRQRYLDLLANPEVRKLFRKKAMFWNTVRSVLVQAGFLEVQTPVLESIPGGADAEPFVTHHNALDRDFYLRISLELPLKRLIVGGYEKVFEIGRLFRNEGMDREHLQEYDDMEFYWAYADHAQGMKLVERLFGQIVEGVSAEAVTSYEGNQLDWNSPWPTVDYFTVFGEKTGLDLNSATEQTLKEYAEKQSIAFDPAYGLGRMIDTIYKKLVRPALVRPSFLVGHPLAISPLAKTDPQNSNKVLRFQVLAGGTELGNGWAELNDPIEQRKRFEEQMKLRLAGDKEAQILDEDFIHALEYGMPPTVGFGMSERVFAVLMDKSIRETVIFPPMKEDLKMKEGDAIRLDERVKMNKKDG